MVVRIFNKRVFRRVNSSMMSVRVESDNEICFGFAKDVSCYGISLFGLKPLAMGKTYDIEFKLPGLGEPVRCSATVRWSRIHTQSYVSTSSQGLMFDDISLDTVQRLDDWVNRDLPRVMA